MMSFDYNSQNPSFFSHANLNYCSLLSSCITKFLFEKEKEMNSGSYSQMTPS